MLQSLEEKDGDYDTKQNALAPEGIEIPEWARVLAQIDQVQERLAKGKAIPEVKRSRADGKSAANASPPCWEESNQGATPRKRDRNLTKSAGRKR